MTIFVDTSALYALLDADDSASGTAREQLMLSTAGDEDLLTTNYVLVETTALVQSRLGTSAVRDLHERLVPLLRVEWLDSPSTPAPWPRCWRPIDGRCRWWTGRASR